MKTFHNILILLAVLLTSACAPRIIDYDPELDDPYIAKGEAEGKPTPPYVEVANKKGIIVDVRRKDDNTHFDEQTRLNLQRWKVSVTSSRSSDRCVTLYWKLMDFRLASDYPTSFLVKGKSSVIYGYMDQQPMDIDGVLVAVSPSGYVRSIYVTKPVKDAKPGDECLYLTDEKDIVER